MSQTNMVDRARWRLRQALGIHSPSRLQSAPAQPEALVCPGCGKQIEDFRSDGTWGCHSCGERAKPLDGGDVFPQEPPLSVRAVMDGEGLVMVRAGDVTDRHGVHVPAGTCDYCPAPGTWWTWLHNGNSECWLEKDFTGPMYDITHLVDEEARTA